MPHGDSHNGCKMGQTVGKAKIKVQTLHVQCMDVLSVLSSCVTSNFCVINLFWQMCFISFSKKFVLYGC